MACAKGISPLTAVDQRIVSGLAHLSGWRCWLAWTLIARHRAESLELGAVLGPCAEGLVEVRALYDAEALKAAEPRWLGGKLAPDHRANQAREDAMAKRLAQAKEPLVVVLLGGAHDLGEALARHARKVRYVRLTTHAYREALRRTDTAGSPG